LFLRSEDSAVDSLNYIFTHKLDSILICLIYLPSLIHSDKIQVDKILNLISIDKLLYIIAGSIQNNHYLGWVFGRNKQNVIHLNNMEFI
jgi:hypothetical protein